MGMTRMVSFIRKRRIELKMSQKETAERAGFSLRKYQRMESGNMDMKEFIKVSGVLGFKLYLVADESEMFLL
jgi:predicted transcriptional regulator